ncbi:hypothetical protein QJS66_17525 [Kocuria rhizophila]|nr:hypothetical protein QJS66_17525 [Kocuria rhizophila]
MAGLGRTSRAAGRHPNAALGRDRARPPPCRARDRGGDRARLALRPRLSRAGSPDRTRGASAMSPVDGVGRPDASGATGRRTPPGGVAGRGRHGGPRSRGGPAG